MTLQHIFETFTNQGITYIDYLELTDNLLAEGKTSGPVQSEILTGYTRLNRARMKRLDKTFQLLPELKISLEKLNKPLLWGVISEAWCGDAAQSVPVIAAIADLSAFIEVRILLRDEFPEIMDCYLTNGGRSIPKLICFDQENEEELFTWGPRPQPAQKMVMELKSRPDISKEEYVEQIQLWYARDRTASIQLELEFLLNSIM